MDRKRQSEVMIMEEKLLNIAEVAGYLNLPEDAVRELVEKGELPAYKIGGQLLRFKKEQVEGYRRRYDSLFKGEGPSKRQEADSDRERLWIDRKNVPDLKNAASYTFWERFEDFLYYNDFYILSLILLILIILAVFGF